MPHLAKSIDTVRRDLWPLRANALRDSAPIVEQGIEIKFHSSHSNLRSPFTRTEISRIVSNLVVNAAEASAKGGMIRVEVGTKNGVPYLSVADEGCGISERFEKRVFDPDFTMKPATGTGIGLSIVKDICERRAALVELSSELHKGTVVTIHLPHEGSVHLSEVAYV